MQRVLRSSLVPGPDGKLQYGGSPFSGLAYEVADDGVVGTIQVVDQGVVTGTSNDWIDLPPGGVRVDASFLEDHSEYGGPFDFGGERFTGVAYWFAGSGECTCESEFVSGNFHGHSERSWYKSGRPERIVRNGEYEGWFEDGISMPKSVARGCTRDPKNKGKPQRGPFSGRGSR